jgi:oligopeptide/dipeptide ABC transporter ATP-binding protein
MLLSIKNLRVSFPAATAGSVPVVDGISLDLEAGSTAALVGESGSGKSVTAYGVMGLLPPTAQLRADELRFEDRDLLGLAARDWRRIRGGRMAMVFQEPMSSLNPTMRVGDQIVEAMVLHTGGTRRDAGREAVRLLSRVGIPAPERRARDYPHELSGGMRQRVMIAMALSCRPALLIADEPTTALDVTIQAQILDLLADMQRREGMAMLLITHDLGVAAQVAERVCVMYAGRLVEVAPTGELFRLPRHPYTRALLESTPRVDGVGRRLHTIFGQVADPANRPSGCAFHPRCPLAQGDEDCRTRVPELAASGEGSVVACWKADAPAERCPR